MSIWEALVFILALCGLMLALAAVARFSLRSRRPMSRCIDVTTYNDKKRRFVKSSIESDSEANQ